MLTNKQITKDEYEFLVSSKQPPVKTGGIAVFRLCLSAFGGYFHPPVETGGIEIGRVKKIHYISCVSGLPVIKLSNDNHVFYFILPLLPPEVIRSTIQRPAMRKIGTYYNPHRKTALSLAPHNSAPQSGFVHRV